MASIRNATLLLNATMRGVVWQRQPKNVAAVNLPMPAIQSPTDAIVRGVAAGICGTDLDTY
jgi:threonine dehydrogenase-like Zn-dependent dehydrogenase